MDKRYQVFVSSTYSDLVDERAEVMQALLELDCMPAGMELFPAANDDQWTWIKKVVDESDYYIVIVGGRYGSMSAVTDMSYTEMEYRYAVESGKPVIGFLHEDPTVISSGKTEQDSAARERLIDFRELVQKRLCKYYSSPADLGAKVSRSLTQLIKQYPGLGWVRATDANFATSAEEVLRLRRRIEELEGHLSRVRVDPPPGSAALASGDDVVELRFEFRRRAKLSNDAGKLTWQNVGRGEGTVATTWDAIFGLVGPQLIGGVDEHRLQYVLGGTLYNIASTEIASKRAEYPEERLDEFHLTEDSYNRVLVQLRGLGLITLVPGEYRDSWALTPYGDTYMTHILAAKHVV